MNRIERAAQEYVLYLKRGMSHSDAIRHPVKYAVMHAPKKWNADSAAIEIVNIAKLNGFEAQA